MSSIGQIAPIREATFDDAAGRARVEAAACGQLASVGVDLAGLDASVGSRRTWMLAEVGGDLLGLLRATVDNGRILVDQLSVEPA